MRNISEMTIQETRHYKQGVIKQPKAMFDNNINKFYGQPNISGCKVSNRQKTIIDGMRILDDGKQISWVEPLFTGDSNPSTDEFGIPDKLPKITSDEDYRRYIRKTHLSPIRSLLSCGQAFNIGEILEHTLGRVRTDLEEREIKSIITDLKPKTLESEFGELHYYMG